MNNPLQEHAHLFANGKFKMEIAPYSFEGHIDPWIEAIHGSIVDKNGESWLVPTSSDFSYSVDRCTLIARPIADMTDEELAGVLETDVYSDEYARELLLERANKGLLLGYHERNMADIGVYFGPQSHFNDGTVININEVK